MAVFVRSAISILAIIVCALLPQRWMWPLCAVGVVAIIMPSRSKQRELLGRYGLLILGPTAVFIVRGFFDPLSWLPWALFIGLFTLVRDAKAWTPPSRVAASLVGIATAIALILRPTWNFQTQAGPLPASTVVVCAGDSLTAGMDSSIDVHTYPTELRRLLGCTVINAGRAGDTTAALLARVDRDILSQRPDIVLVFIGGNDSLGDTPRAAFARDLDLLVARIAAAGPRIVLVQVPAGIVVDPYAGVYERVARRHGARLVPESWLRWRYVLELLFRGYMDDPMTLDGIHLSPSGAAEVANWLAEHVRAAAGERDRDER